LEEETQGRKNPIHSFGLTRVVFTDQTNAKLANDFAAPLKRDHIGRNVSLSITGSRNILSVTGYFSGAYSRDGLFFVD